MQDYVQVIVNTGQQGHDAVSQTERLLKQIDSTFMLVDGLRHIAEQTGLLALNAALEAAKTGNLGRTYSYVIKEVQGLSVQSDDVFSCGRHYCSSGWIKIGILVFSF